MKAAIKLNQELQIEKNNSEHTTEPVTQKISQHTLKTETFSVGRAAKYHMNTMLSCDSLKQSIVEGTSMKFNQKITRRPPTSSKPKTSQYKPQSHERQSTRYDIQKFSNDNEKFKSCGSMHELRLRKQPVKLCILNSAKSNQNLFRRHNKSSIFAKDQETSEPDVPSEKLSEQQGCKVTVSSKSTTQLLIHRKLNPIDLQSSITIIKSIKLKQL